MPTTDDALAVEAAEAGAAVVRSHDRGSLTRFAKAAGDFATDVDVAAEQAVVDVLRAARPDDAVLGEESGRIGTGDDRRLWLVDPLCGTLNYAVQNMLASVNVALRSGTRVAVAASADPFADEVFWTDGIAAYVRHGSRDEPLTRRRAAYVTDGHLSDSVHFAAGIALCQAAGCVVTGIDGQPIHTGVGVSSWPPMPGRTTPCRV